MWTWTCSACGAVFRDAEKSTAEQKFLGHARTAHNPALLLSFVGSDEGA